MRRRQFILGLGGAGAWPLVAVRAERGASAPKIGVLSWYGLETAYRLEPFRKALHDLGYVEGQNLLIAYRFAEGRTDRAAAFAAELARDQVDIIIALATPAAHAAKNATQDIPIVFVAADALGTGLVPELARPGGNITGMSLMMPDVAGKRLELLQTLLPGISQIAFLGSMRDPAALQFMRQSESAAQKMGIRFQSVLVTGPELFDEAFTRMKEDGVTAVTVQSLLSNEPTIRAKIIELALRHRLPTTSDYAEFATSGGLVAYGPDREESVRKVAFYVDRILKGARPGDLAVEQPTRFYLVINKKTAAMLGIEVPPELLARADEVIE